MKKLIAFLAVLALCLSLCACGGKSDAVKVTTEEVEDTFAELDGTLDMETSGDNVTSFTYVVEEVNADDLMDKDYTREAIATVMTGDTSQITLGQVKVAQAVIPLMNIEVLLGNEEEEFDSDAFVEKILGIICDGDTAEYDGWTVSASVDEESDSITISASSK